jgi:hypothetical protein
MKYFITLLLSTLILFLFYCCNGNELPVPKEEGIYLSKSILSFGNCDDSVRNITVRTKGIINLDKQPDWLDLYVDQQNKLIKVSVKPNYSRQSRETQVKVFDENSESYLHISQSGEAEEKEPFIFKYFPTSEINSYGTSEEGATTVYHFKAYKFFINQKINNEIYLGNILNYKFYDLENFQTFEDYILNDVTVIADIIIDGKLYIEEWKTPSKIQLDKLAELIINDVPKENKSFYVGEPIVFRSYKYLHFLSKANLGFGIDEIMRENLYPDKSMEKDIGLIYSYSQSLFSILADPSFLAPREETDFIFQNNLSYINNITYGKTAFLIVESDGSKQAVDSIIKKVKLKENLSDEEKILINRMDIFYLYFSPDGTLQKDKSEDNIEKIINFYQVENNNIIPLNFSVLDYITSGRKAIEYAFSL